MPRDKSRNGIVKLYGKLWTRVPANLKKLRSKELKKLTGVYVLYNGTMPVYIGRGKICQQIQDHARNKKKSQFWEHFSWYEIDGEALGREIESLLLRILPFYVRSLNKKGGDFFLSGMKIDAASEVPIKPLWPKGGAGKKRHRNS
jgi:hypothetical protein